MRMRVVVLVLMPRPLTMVKCSRSAKGGEVEGRVRMQYSLSGKRSKAKGKKSRVRDACATSRQKSVTAKQFDVVPASEDHDNSG
jgi:hypothetical protein